MPRQHRNQITRRPMIRHKIYDRLLNWKNTAKGTKALLIEGARQVGKTTTVTEFARREYRSHILVDFNCASRKILSLYDGGLNNLDIFFQILSLEYGTCLHRRESLIIFDGVQKFPQAREAVKYLVADGRYDFIETGSQISIRENVDPITIPSEERKLKMHPADFEEFLLFMGHDALIEHIRECFQQRQPLEQSLHMRVMHLFSEYILVGGMPGALTAYRNSGRDFLAAEAEKRDILNQCQEEIRQAPRRYSARAAGIFRNIPGYLSAREKKVVLSRIKACAEFDRYSDPLFWLGDSMLCNICYKCDDPSKGFALSKNESAVKCYMGDTGLLATLAAAGNEAARQKMFSRIMDGRLSLDQGMLYENAIAQILSAKGAQLYFFTRYSTEKHRNDIDIAFLLPGGCATDFRVRPVEIRSSRNYSTLSVGRFMEQFRRKAVRPLIIHPKNLEESGGVLRIPPYMLALCDV